MPDRCQERCEFGNAWNILFGARTLTLIGKITGWCEGQGLPAERDRRDPAGAGAHREGRGRSGYPHDMDGVAGHVGRSLLAFWSLKRIDSILSFAKAT